MNTVHIVNVVFFFIGENFTIDFRINCHKMRSPRIGPRLSTPVEVETIWNITLYHILSSIKILYTN